MGFSAEPIVMSGLSKSLQSCSVFLDDAVVPAENRLGAEGEGFAIAMNALEYGRLAVSSRLIGLAQACLDHAVAYARDRVVGGRPIAEYQMIQHLIADMAVNIDAARGLTRHMAECMARGEPSIRASSRAKYFAGIAARHAAQSAADIFAAQALAAESPIAKITAYVNMLCVGEGIANVQRILIAEDALGLKDANRHSPRNRFAEENPPGEQTLE